ncbi:protein-glutamate O-methyltransferase CheR [Chromobacterium subtsugae]|uniref:Chemotaxis protein methyltransferase n=1 Tax=Chromobacterium subtsugae TaxID=251747 RepID=A0ABS7FET4_9NEIS|nr:MULTISPECIES: protein-glutamate O-methyltransferase CheR [Chromobacterium]KUM05111.1 chemotaxis protein [Chromobacterium subtsugae]KZE88162.1 chemotaxis protein [Chromobacterium sp. F49]MBW7565664.1 protein-glutamate O-methyltransferase CheR [Chromobacterium subtsugae]MBW8287995.1 protein-glutamate O-methyltransferase CheR [Chromobacterium subtsugae]OBU86868.1 chemotaxis protein [Chromobacterium subtsugae]
MLNRDPVLSDEEFAFFRQFIFREAGIDLPPGKRSLVQSRLSKRIRHLGLASYSAYWQLLRSPSAHAERQRAINLLSTNETYFFREPQHFHWLEREAQHLRDIRPGMLRVWSAACSTGEEPYTIAMVLAEALGLSGNWKIYATDINTKVLAAAKRAVYPIERARRTPPHFWQKYFLRGHDEYEGMVKVAPELARRVDFANLNLLHCDKFHHGEFDIVFLRNVLIYFNETTKLSVLSNLCTRMKQGGHLLIGHSESLHKLALPLVQEEPSRYRLDASRMRGGGK